MSAQAMAAQGKAGRRKKHEEHEEHENHERWLITYADMITLLMVLFIVLYSIGQTDLKKFEQLQSGLAEGFGNDSAGVLESGDALVATETVTVPVAGQAEAEAAVEARESARQAIADDQAALERTREALSERLDAAGLGGNVDLRVDARGLIVTIVTDQVLFQPGSDTVLPAGRSILEPIADSLSDLPNDISVEGHTDSSPISTARFPSNWELSTARATSVLRLLQSTAPIPAERLAAAGYADTRPIGDNATPQGRSANRRVEVVVHSVVDRSALVAQVAGTDVPPTTVDPIADPIPEADHG